MNKNDDDFLARWSKRKIEARKIEEQATPPEETSEEVENPSDENAAGASAEQDADIQQYFDDVNFEELDYDSDYTRFMKEGVPEMVRRKALRQLWASDPILANLDGLNEYDEDYTDAALAVKALQSAWKPGQGYDTPEDEPKAASTETSSESEEKIAQDDQSVQESDEPENKQTSDQSGVEETSDHESPPDNIANTRPSSTDPNA